MKVNKKLGKWRKRNDEFIVRLRDNMRTVGCGEDEIKGTIRKCYSHGRIAKPCLYSAVLGAGVGLSAMFGIGEELRTLMPNFDRHILDITFNQLSVHGAYSLSSLALYLPIGLSIGIGLPLHSKLNRINETAENQRYALKHGKLREGKEEFTLESV